MLFRSLEGTTLYTTDGDYTNYYLSKGDAGVGFYKVTKEDGVKVGANRCYLPILTEIPANGSTGDTELIKVTPLNRFLIIRVRTSTSQVSMPRA